jgi:hypothetical protein
MEPGSSPIVRKGAEFRNNLDYGLWRLRPPSQAGYCPGLQLKTMDATKWRARTIPHLIIEVWEALDCESVGARELEQIQNALREKFGEGALISPAAIARAVADEGAVLRHPEVFNCDLKWRRQEIEKGSFQGGLNFNDLASAFESVVRIEEKRLQIELQRGTREQVDTVKGKGGTDKKTEQSRELRGLVTAAREELLLRSRSKILEESQRQQANEIAEWLRVWLEAPELFSDWLDLRRRSPEFRKRFNKEQTANSKQ